MNFTNKSTYFLHMKDSDEYISISKPNFTVNNIIYGGVYVDVLGKMEAMNHKTKEKAYIQFHPKSGNKNAWIEGKGFNSEG